MNVVFIVPTGVGAEIGGHSGDATPAAKLIASVCDKLIVHPNVVNASDINEMTDNMLYVEGSMLDAFLEGRIGLQEVYSNEILMVVNDPILPETINAVNTAKNTIGADIKLIALNKPLTMTVEFQGSVATGHIDGIDSLVAQVRNKEFDVLIVNTPIQTDDATVKDYLTSIGGVNPWGGVEAKLSKILTGKLNKRPVFHAPIENSPVMKTFNEVVDPRKAAELVSVCYVHCCFKGAHKAPRTCSYGKPTSLPKLSVSDIDFLISPAGLYGTPHLACDENKIPIIRVMDNKTAIDKSDRLMAFTCDDIYVKNYLEAAGVIAAKKAGVTLASVTNSLEDR